MTAVIVQTDSHACDTGCCVVIVDSELVAEASIYGRPMFQVLNDDPDYAVLDRMTVRAVDYDLPGGVLL